jgi:hypothetical protein
LIGVLKIYSGFAAMEWMAGSVRQNHDCSSEFLGVCCDFAQRAVGVGGSRTAAARREARMGLCEAPRALLPLTYHYTDFFSFVKVFLELFEIYSRDLYKMEAPDGASF